MIMKKLRIIIRATIISLQMTHAQSKSFIIMYSCLPCSNGGTCGVAGTSISLVVVTEWSTREKVITHDQLIPTKQWHNN